MKRSHINHYLDEFIFILKKYQFLLPRFAHYSLDDWKKQPKEVISYVAQNGLGWDITDFNLGHFKQAGLSLFTLRNGELNLKPPYAEKIMHVQKNQTTPMHYHKYKIEDIINRGGGQLIIQFYQAQGKNIDEKKDIFIYQDHKKMKIKAGGKIILNPGDSIRIPCYIYHSFWAEKQDVLAGEVSMTNDDKHDNIFLEALGRFSHIIEDETPLRLLCNEYNHWT